MTDKMSRRTGLWAKLGFREWVITIVKNVSDTNICSVKIPGVACYSRNKIIIIL